MAGQLHNFEHGPAQAGCTICKESVSDMLAIDCPGFHEICQPCLFKQLDEYGQPQKGPPPCPGCKALPRGKQPHPLPVVPPSLVHKAYAWGQAEWQAKQNERFERERKQWQMQRTQRQLQYQGLGDVFGECPKCGPQDADDANTFTLDNSLSKTAKADERYARKCGKCQSALCMACGRESHEGTSCNDVQGEARDQAFSELQATIVGSKQCPACRALCTKARGHYCHHVTCTNCDYNFCFVCLATIPAAGAAGRSYRRCLNGCNMTCSQYCDCGPCGECKQGQACHNCTSTNSELAKLQGDHSRCPSCLRQPLSEAKAAKLEEERRKAQEEMKSMQPRANYVCSENEARSGGCKYVMGSTSNRHGPAYASPQEEDIEEVQDDSDSYDPTEDGRYEILFAPVPLHGVGQHHHDGDTGECAGAGASGSQAASSARGGGAQGHTRAYAPKAPGSTFNAFIASRQLPPDSASNVARPRKRQRDEDVSYDDDDDDEVEDEDDEDCSSGSSDGQGGAGAVDGGKHGSKQKAAAAAALDRPTHAKPPSRHSRFVVYSDEEE